MSSVKEGKVNNHAPQNPALEQPQQRSANHQSCKALREAHKRAHQPPQGDEGGEIHPSSEALDEPIGGDIGDDVWDVKDEEGDVVLGAFEVQFSGEAGDICVADVGAVDEGEEP